MKVLRSTSLLKGYGEFMRFGKMKFFGLIMLMLGQLASLSLPTHAQERGMMLGTLTDQGTILNSVMTLRSYGATCARFPIYLGHDGNLDGWLAKINYVLPFMEANSMVLIIDMHQANRGYPDARNIANVDQFDADWVKIATAYKGKRKVWFDLLNEPGMPMSVWRPIAQRTATKIRQVNGASPIVFSSPGADVSTYIGSLRPLDGISNQVLQLHFWNWAGGTSMSGDVQSVYNPISYPNEGRGRTKIRMGQLLDEVAALQARTGTPVLIGEVGISASHPNAPRFLRDFTDACKARGLHLCIHAFREAGVWNYESNAAAWTIVTTWLRG